MKERIIESNDNYEFKILEFAPGENIGCLIIDNIKKTFYCLYGSGLLKTSTSSRTYDIALMPGRHMTIEPNTAFTIAAFRDSHLAVAYVSGPQPKPERAFMDPFDYAW